MKYVIVGLISGTGIYCICCAGNALANEVCNRFADAIAKALFPW